MNRRDTVLIISALAWLLHGCASEKKPVATKPPPDQMQVSNNDILSEIERIQKDAKLDKVKDSFTICSVNDTPLTMGEYRRQLKAQQQQMQSSLTVNPQVRVELLRMARERKISLTDSEKKQMLDRALALRKGGTKAFTKMLKDNKISQADFDKEVLEMGLACKTSKELIEDSLIRQLINRQLLCSAAKANGFSKQALKSYSEAKQTPQYLQSLQSSGLTAEAAEQEVIKNELCTLMINKIESASSVSDADLRKFYDDNKARLKHGPRVRLSQILIKAPVQDQAGLISLMTQLHKAHPELKDAELNKLVETKIAEQKQKADSLFIRARSGADFAELANQNTEDVPAISAKNGGDLGFQEEGSIPEVFLNQLKTVKVGEVTPQLVQSPIGFHIIKLTAREPAGMLPYDECKEKIKGFLAEQKSRQAVQKWLTEQRLTAKITLSPDFQALLASIGKENKEKNIRTP